MSKLRFIFFLIGLLFSFISLLNAQSEYKYSYIPKKVYENQLFPVTIVGQDSAASLVFDTSSSVQPLFNRPLQVKNGSDSFYTFYFKAGTSNVRIPTLFISSSNSKSSLKEQLITILPLKKKGNFSGVLAANMKIKGQQVSNFDGNNHMITLSIEAFEANIEDMSLNNVNEFGIEALKRKNAKVTAEFYAVLPREQKKLDFSYFNTLKRQFKTFTIPVEVADASVTTQSDLNPKVDAFKRLKRYALIVFSIFFILMFLWKRDFFYLILGVISIVTLLTFYIPHKKICVKQGSPLYIIPTNTSTIGTRVEHKLDTMLLGTRGEYNKIEYKPGIIGWIKNEDICKN